MATKASRMREIEHTNTVIYCLTSSRVYVLSSAGRWKEAAKKTRAERPLYTREAPPGFTPVNEEVWKAWHYGVHTVESGPIQQ